MPADPLARLRLEEPVLVQLPSLLDREVPQDDVVLLRPGEVEEGRPVLLLLEDPHVDLDPVLQEDAGLRRPPLDDPVHARIAHQTLRRLAVAAEDVEVAYGAPAPPEAPGHVDLDARGSRSRPPGPARGRSPRRGASATARSSSSRPTRGASSPSPRPGPPSASPTPARP